MARLVCFVILVYLVQHCPARLVNHMLGLEEDATEFFEGRKLTEENYEDEENEVDPRLVKKYAENSIGSYECSTDIQCSNGGECIDTGDAGSICNCTTDHMGPFCEYSTNSIDKALRVHPLFKVSFAECMTKAGKTAGINAITLLEKCGGGQNMCWFREGGVKGLKCFFWCLTNGMRLSLKEAKPSEESRLQLYAEVFQKFARARNLPDSSEPNPNRVPLASLQINLYDTSQKNYPYPKHNTFSELPEISIKPSVSFWTPNESPKSQEPYGSPYASSNDGSVFNPFPSEEDVFRYPKSHEIPTAETKTDGLGSLDGGELSDPFWDGHSGPYDTEFPSDFPREVKSKEELSEDESVSNPNFLNDALHGVMMDIYASNVVEASESGDDYDEYMTSPFLPYSDVLPFHDAESNMRNDPLPTEEA